MSKLDELALILNIQPKPIWRRLRPVELNWPVAEFVLRYEWARYFYISFLFFEFTWFALDHIHLENVKLRHRKFNFGLLPA